MMPKKYIELDAALAALGEEPCKWVDYSEALTQEHNDWECHYNAISAIPAADVMEVVRCANCKHWQQRDNREYGLCAKHRGIWLNSDYCSKCERKDGGKHE